MAASLGKQLQIDRVIAGEHRLAPDDALRLFDEASLHDLGRWATAVAERKHGSAGGRAVRTYVIDRNINYTNVCTARCTFCAFRRDETDDDAYVLDTAQLHQKVRELVDIGGTQVLLQGGMHPGLGLDWYRQMLTELKRAFPGVHIHGFSPPELVEFIALLELDGFPSTGPGQSHTLDHDVWLAKLDAVMRELMAAGLDSLPGGGGEIFAPHVRRRIGIGKATAGQWLDVMATAHRLGMHTSATMMFGHIEGVADRVDHMQRVRDRQDRAIAADWPGRYVSFISWPFQRENTPLGRAPEWDLDAAAPGSPAAPGSEADAVTPFPGDVLAERVLAGEVDGEDPKACVRAVPKAGKVVRMAGAVNYLRTQAISRLMLDNIDHIGSSWVTMGPRIGQLGLAFGADDMGSVMMEENVVSAAGTTYCLTEPVLCHLIRGAGYTPAQRDNLYRHLHVHRDDDPDSPDLAVEDWSTQRAGKLHVETAGDAAGRAHPHAVDTVPLTVGTA
jgi:cyclic dehypoxanthinyl futalosine synthase